MTITESDIRKLTTGKSYHRGWEYYRDDYVNHVQKQGKLLLGDVKGSYGKYLVKIKLDGDDIVSTSCSCPYDCGGMCKHIVAVLLTYVYQSPKVDEVPPVEDLLSGFGEADLRRVLIRIVESKPELIDLIATEASLLKRDGKKRAGSSKQTACYSSKTPFDIIDPSPFGQRARKILRESRDDYDCDYDSEHEIVHSFGTLCQEVKTLLEAGDGGNALLILKAITEPLLESLYEFEYYAFDGVLDELSIEIAPLFAEALLSTELSEYEKKSWKEQLNEWQDILIDSGAESIFEVVLIAFKEGWDDPHLTALLQGKEMDKSLPESEEQTYYSEELILIRLKILERQGRYEEYLRLAESDDQILLYLIMLVKMGKGGDAVKYAIKNLILVEQAMELVLVLKEKGLNNEALKVAEYGLTMNDGKKLDLARWLRHEAREQSKNELALKGALTAFAESSALEDYLAVKEQAGAEWEKLKPALLTESHANTISYGGYHGKIEILLHEKMFKEVTELMDGQRYWDDGTIALVIEAVSKELPDWAIGQCRLQAEPNLNQGKSKYYADSVRWIEKAGKIYLSANRRKEWLEYLDGLMEKHQRKYSLRPQLEALKKLKN